MELWSAARAAFLIGSAAASTMLPLSAAAAQGQAAADYDLPSQPLGDTLQAIAQVAGEQVLFPSAAVEGRTAPPVKGRLRVDEALSRALAGTALTVEHRAGALIVRERLPAETGGAAATGDASAITVTGTHVRGASPTSPLVVLTRDDIERTGATSADELMRTVPQNSESGVNNENALVVVPDKDPTDHGAGINLRGLGQRATLVLLDGRRLAPSGYGAFVDVSMIPLSAVQRVDILTDGASAIYGSDAVGGVVNFVLRDKLDGLESSLEAGTTTDGGGSEVMISQAGGTSWTGGRALLAYEFRNEEEVKAAQRPFTINLPGDTYLLPSERKNSLVGTIEQELAPSLRASVTATFGHRRTERTFFQSTSALPVGVDATATSRTVSGELAYELPNNWLARFDGNSALSTTSQIQSQPGGTPVINSRDVRNAAAGGELHLDGPLVELPGGSVRLALGGELRLERYRQAFESSVFPRSIDRSSRRVTSAYGELAIPLFSSANRMTGLEQLELSAAARYDHYQRSGSSFDPKLGVLWSPAPGVSLRASYSTSFRAPLLSESTGDYSGIYLPAVFFYADPPKAPPGGVALFLQGSNPDVRPETSRNWTLGGDWMPGFLPGLKLTANYYSIRYSDRIALPAPRINVVDNPAFASIVTVNPDPGAVAAIVAGASDISDFAGPGFTSGGITPADVEIVLDDRVTNTSFTATSGLDLGLRYAFNLGSSSFVADADLTHIIRFDQQLNLATPVVHALNRVYQPLRWRGRGGLSWKDGGWNGSLFVNYSGDYLDDRAVALRRVRAAATVDANLGYSFPAGAAAWLHGMRVGLVADNLLDARPPRIGPDPASTTGLGYDPVNASARGRFVAVQLRRSW